LLDRHPGAFLRWQGAIVPRPPIRAGRPRYEDGQHDGQTASHPEKAAAVMTRSCICLAQVRRLLDRNCAPLGRRPTRADVGNRRALRRSTPYRPRKLLLRLGSIGSQALPAVLKRVLQQCQAERKRTNVVKRRFPGEIARHRRHRRGGLETHGFALIQAPATPKTFGLAIIENKSGVRNEVPVNRARLSRNNRGRLSAEAPTGALEDGHGSRYGAAPRPQPVLLGASEPRLARANFASPASA
jgi:hypothetical protein